MALEALETWVVPTLALTSAALFWLFSTLDVWPEAVAIVGIAASLLVLTLFAAFRHYFFAGEPRRRQAAIGFAVAWGLLLFTVFYRHIFPGDPLASGVLRPGGESVTVPSAGIYALVVDGQFIAAQGQGNRLGHYHLEILRDGEPPKAIEGAFEDSFAHQRLGRRGSTIVEVQHTSQRHVVGLDGGAKVRLVSADPTLEPALRVSLYTATRPWVFPLLGGLGVLAALALEKWLDGDGSATMAASVTFFVVDQYVRWAAPHPQFRSLVGAILVGGIIGAPLAALAWRVVPRRWIVPHR